MEIVDKPVDTQSDSQYDDLRYTLLTDFCDKIRNQLSVLLIQTDPVDQIAECLKGFFNYNTIDSLETRDIYVAENMDEKNKEDLLKFSNTLNQYFDSYWGIRTTEPDIFIYYCLYTTLFTKFIDYFIYFINGLQKLDEDYVEDLPNYEEYTFTYYLNHYSRYNREDITRNDSLKFPLISDYINYIIELGIKPELYFQIALMESEGDVMLSNLFMETANNRIIYDSEFFNLKIKKLSETPEFELIINQLTEYI